MTQNVDINDIIANSELDFSQFQNPLKKIHDFIYSSVLKNGKLKNCFEDDKNEYRSFAFENDETLENGTNKLSELIREDDGTYQLVDFSKDDQKIVWLINHEGEKHFLVQNGESLEDLVQIESYDIATVYKNDDVAYLLHFLTQFNSGKIFLGDETEKSSFNEVHEHVKSVIHDKHSPLTQLLTSTLYGKENFKEILPGWDSALPIDHENNVNNVITFGVFAETNDDSVLKHKVIKAMVWFKPDVQSADGEDVPFDGLSMTALYIANENVPDFRPNNTITVSVTEKLPKSVKGVLILTEDVLGNGLAECKLYRTEDFDITKTI